MNMEWLFGKRKDIAALLADQQAVIAAAQRKLVRELSRSQATEAQQQNLLEQEVEKERLDLARLYAKRVQQERHTQRRCVRYQTDLAAIASELSEVAALHVVRANMCKAERIMSRMNRALPGEETRNMLVSFQRNRSMLKDGQELVQEAVAPDSDAEAETDADGDVDAMLEIAADNARLRAVEAASAAEARRRRQRKRAAAEKADGGADRG